MNRHDNLFRPENVDEQVEDLAHIHGLQQQSLVPGAPTIAALTKLYEEDEDILQRAWMRISSAPHATETSGNTLNTFENKGKTKMRTERTSPEAITTLLSSRSGKQAQRSDKRWNIGLALAVAVVILVLNIVIWSWMNSLTPPTGSHKPGNNNVTITATATSCGTLPAGTNVASPANTPGMKLYQSKGYALLYPQTWQGEQDAQGNGRGAKFNNADSGASLRVSNAFDSGATSPSSTMVDNALPYSSYDVTVKNFHMINVARTVKLAGIEWEQRAGVGDFTQDGKTVTTKQVVLVAMDPMQCGGSMLIIHYQAPLATFDGINASAFQPMLQSFTFTK